MAYCQVNDFTRSIKINDRFIFGTGANAQVFRVKTPMTYILGETEVDGSEQIGTIFFEFTSTQDSDDLERGIAGAGLQNWTLLAQDIAALEGTSGTVNTIVTLNGEKQKVPLSFVSSDKKIISFDKRGEWTAHAEGEATIIVSLRDNPAIKTEIKAKVESQGHHYHIRHTPITEAFRYETTNFAAHLQDFESQLPNSIGFEFSGVPAANYVISNRTDNSFDLYVRTPFSQSPLVITMSSEVDGETIATTHRVWLRN
jgi:hypothetical protein